jgi:hypothetical protein
MKIIYGLLLFFSIYALCSCDKDIEYKFKAFKSQMVVNGLISPEDGLLVRVSRSVTPDADTASFSSLFINDAKVKLVQSSGKEILLRFTINGEYISQDSFFPQPKTSYILIVTHPDFGIVESEPVIIPQKIQIESIKADFSDRLSINDEQLVQYKIKLKDDLAVKNFYNLQFFNNYATINRRTSASNVFLKNLSTLNACQSYDYQTMPYFNDQCFNGKTAELIYETEVENLLIATGGKRVLPTTMEVNLLSLTETAFNYYRSRKVPEDFEHTFSDPLPLVSNMKGGLGIFIAYSKTSFVFPVPK